MYITTKIVWKTLWHGFLLVLYYSQSLWSCIFFEEHKKEYQKLQVLGFFFIFFWWHMLMFIGVFFWHGFFERHFFMAGNFYLNMICGTYELFIYYFSLKKKKKLFIQQWMFNIFAIKLNCVLSQNVIQYTCVNSAHPYRVTLMNKLHKTGSIGLGLGSLPN